MNTARLRAAGFTLLELMMVIAIVAVAAAGVSFALRDASGQQLEREGQRLAALLDSARARSRLTGQPLRWVATEEGFRFEGVGAEDLPKAWLQPGTHAAGGAVLVLGPEPIIEPQAVVITAAGQPQHALRIATDGLRPFTVAREGP